MAYFLIAIGAAVTVLAIQIFIDKKNKNKI